MAQTTSQVKPSLPEGYTVPEIWESKDMGAGINSMNAPTAGARSEEELPKGEHPIQLYSLGTPNGVKVTILLEELGIEYDAWKINIFQLKQFTSGFVNANPNSKIPCLMDYAPEDGGDPLRVFESGSILLYLAKKYNKFWPTDIRTQTECMNWLMWQMSTAPVIGGGFGHFYNYAPVKIEYAIDRFAMETKRILDVLDKHLEGKSYVCGEEYTIADMAIMPWIQCIDVGYNAAKFLQLDMYKNVVAWRERLQARKAVKRGMRVNGFRADMVEHRHSKADFAAEDYD